MKKNSDVVRLSDANSRIVRICQQLLEADVMDKSELDNGKVPKERGIYLWRHKEDESAAYYVGVALGERGLKGRIIGQHLRPSYEQSVFRKAIVKYSGVNSRDESVDYIKKHFTLALAACPDQEPAVILAAEALLIAALRPKFNNIKGLMADIQGTEAPGEPRHGLPGHYYFFQQKR